jgi:protein-tyrosine phosphatase
VVFGFALGLLGLALTGLAIATGRSASPAALPVALGLLWPGLDLLLVGGAYLLRRPGVLGKQRDGSLAWWSMAVHLPLLVGTWVIWHLQRKVRSEPPSDEVYPGVWVGRRPFKRELPAGVALVVDLTAEFPVDPALGREVEVVLVPTLDGTAPDLEAARVVVDRLVADARPMLIHCAAGRGRSAAVAALLARRRGLAPTVEAAEALMRARRPGIGLNREQRALVRALAPE